MAGEGLIVDYRYAVEEQIHQKEKFLGEGKAKTFDEYRDISGQIKGLKKSIDVFNDTIKRYYSEEEGESE